MSQNQKNNSLQDILQNIDSMSQNKDRVSVDDIVDVIGRRTYGPLLVFIGLFLAVPGASDIPGVAIACGAVVVLTVGQQLFGRETIWLPDWLLRRSVKEKYIDKSLQYADKFARFIDRITTKRLTFLVENRVSYYISAIICILISLLTPATTVIFLSANLVGVCLLLFGLAYITDDGLVMLLSYLVFFGFIALLVFGFA